MMTEEDVALSKEAIATKYLRGSPGYPSHREGCACSGCYASWVEWRSAHAAYELGFKAGRERALRWTAKYVESLGAIPDVLVEAAQAAIASGEI